jgi:hypothetical protein
MIRFITMNAPARRQLLRRCPSFSSGSSASGKCNRKFWFGRIIVSSSSYHLPRCDASKKARISGFFRKYFGFGYLVGKTTGSSDYIYERITKYNPEKHFNEVISNHLIGKIPAGKTEMVSTRPHRAKTSVPEFASCKRVGVTDILEWIGRESGVDQDLLHAADRATAEKILSIARYWSANPGKTIPFIEEWQISHDIPYQDGISQDGCYALMKAIGTDAGMRQKFFCARADRMPSKSSIAFDSTTISSYSENQIEARHGYNKNGDGLKCVKLLTQYCLETGQPIAYARQPGNIPDVISIVNASTQLSVFGMEKPMFVMDAGFYSEDIMLTPAYSHIKFLVAGKLSASWIKSEFDKILSSICQLSNNCPLTRACTERQSRFDIISGGSERVPVAMPRKEMWW